MKPLLPEEEPFQAAADVATANVPSASAGDGSGRDLRSPREPMSTSMPRFILTGPEFAGQWCELPDGRFAVGRSRRNQIILLDESVSAQHCELLVYGTEVIVRDCGSRNGVFVNGVRVKAQSGVYNGQRLRFGRVEGLIQIARPAGEWDTAITAFHDHCRTMQRPDLPLSAPSHLVVFTPSRVVSAGDQTRALSATALPAAPCIAPADRSNLCFSRGSENYWQTLLRLLHL